MAEKRYISGFGFDLADLQIKPERANDKYVYDPTSPYLGYATPDSIFRGIDFGDSSLNLCTLAKSVCDNRVKVFKSNIFEQGVCFMYIPDQVFKVGDTPDKLQVYTVPEAKQVLFTNVIKVLFAIKKETGLTGFTTKTDVINLINTAKQTKRAYDPNIPNYIKYQKED